MFKTEYSIPILQEDCNSEDLDGKIILLEEYGLKLFAMLILLYMRGIDILQPSAEVYDLQSSLSR